MAKSKRGSKTSLSREEIDEFELVSSQLARFHSELQLLSKGKGLETMNEFKLQILNGLLRRANALLGSRYKPIVGFDEFSAVQLPSVSDATVVLSQYIGALEKLRADHIAEEMGSWYWILDGEVSDLETERPHKLGRR